MRCRWVQWRISGRICGFVDARSVAPRMVLTSFSTITVRWTDTTDSGCNGRKWTCVRYTASGGTCTSARCTVCLPHREICHRQRAVFGAGFPSAAHVSRHLDSTTPLFKYAHLDLESLLLVTTSKVAQTFWWPLRGNSLLLATPRSRLPRSTWHVHNGDSWPCRRRDSVAHAGRSSLRAHMMRGFPYQFCSFVRPAIGAVDALCVASAAGATLDRHATPSSV